MSYLSTVAVAHPGHSDIAAVHGDGFSVWFVHQLLDTDNLLTIVVFAVLVAMTGGRLFRGGGNSVRRRRLRG